MSTSMSPLWYYPAVESHALLPKMLSQLKHMGRHDTQPKVTFYLTLVFELHADMEQYTYSIE